MRRWWAGAASVVIGWAVFCAGTREAGAAPRSALEEAVLVTAARLERDVATIGATSSVLDVTELLERGIHRAADALPFAPGTYVGQSGAPGGAASLFLRGAGSNQTIVVVDGVQVNDPTIGGQFNFYDLDLANVERVEVLRGAASAAWGSEAIGGVVNVVTQRGRGEPRFRFSGEGGSFGHYRVALSGTGSDGPFDLSGAFSRDRWGNDLPRQDYHAETFAAAVGFEPAEGTRLELRGRFIDSYAEDPWDFPFTEQIETDPNIRRVRRTGVLAFTATQELADDLELSLTGSLFDAESDFRNGPDSPGDPVELRSLSDAETWTGLATLRWRLPPVAEWLKARLLAGYELEDERSENTSESAFGPGPEIDRTVRNRAGFLLLEAEILDRLVLGGGARLDRNSFFGTETTFSASASYRLVETGTTFRANYGEAFRAPKPVEFDEPFVGNPDLGPEKAVHFDAGVAQELFEGDLLLSATIFQLDGRDFIAFDFDTFRLENFGRIRVRGVEFAATVRPCEDVVLRAFATIQDPEDRKAGPGEEEQLPGRPKRFGGFDATWTIDPVDVGLSLLASSEVPGVGYITPDGHHRDSPGEKLVVTLRATWRISDSVRVFARVENLLNDEYYDVETAPNGLPLGVYAGFEAEF